MSSEIKRRYRLLLEIDRNRIGFMVILLPLIGACPDNKTTRDPLQL